MSNESVKNQIAFKPKVSMSNQNSVFELPSTTNILLKLEIIFEVWVIFKLVVHIFFQPPPHHHSVTHTHTQKRIEECIGNLIPRRLLATQRIHSMEEVRKIRGLCEISWTKFARCWIPKQTDRWSTVCRRSKSEAASYKISEQLCAACCAASSSAIF